SLQGDLAEDLLIDPVRELAVAAEIHLGGKRRFSGHSRYVLGLASHHPPVLHVCSARPACIVRPRLWSGTARKVRPSDSVPPAHGFLLIAPTHVDKSSDDIHILSTAGRRRNRRPGIQRQGQGAKTMSFHELTK